MQERTALCANAEGQAKIGFWSGGQKRIPSTGSMGHPPEETQTAPSPGAEMDSGDGDLAPRVPCQIGRYRIIELIGSGGAGEVFRGHDPQLERPVAIKRLKTNTNDPSGRQLLASEARINARLEHPNVVRVYDFLSVGSGDFLISEFVNGPSLAHSLEAEREDIDFKLGLALGICRGLSYAHAAGIVHLDLKRENILLSPGGIPKIADFGIARLLDNNDQGAQSDGIRGTFRSMSPEQTLGAETDARSDLFSLGTLFYEIFSGQSPFHVPRNSLETVRRIRQESPLPLAELRAEVPRTLSLLIQKLHNKDPALRPRSASEVETTLVALMERRPRVSAHPAEPHANHRLLAVMSCHLDLHAVSDAKHELAAVVHFQEQITLLAERHDAYVMNAFGNEAVLCFGYPLPQDNLCERAARFLLRLTDEYRTTISESTATIRAGLDLGEAMISGRTAVGRAFSESAGLCASAACGELLVSSAAQLILRRFFRFEKRAKTESASPTGETPTHYALVGRGVGRTSVLVGREKELTQLYAAWNAAQRGRASCVLVSGVAGIGKSRLLLALAERVGEEANVLELAARPEDQYLPFAPFRSISPEYGELRADSMTDSGVQLTNTLVDVKPNGKNNEGLREQRIEQLVSKILARAHHSDLLVVLEDAHWLDHSSFDLLRALQKQTPARRLMLLLSGRPECVDFVRERLEIHHMRLPRLAHEHAHEIVRAMSTDQAPLAHRLTARVIEAAEGLPLLLEELTLSLGDRTTSSDNESTSQWSEVSSTLTESLDHRLATLGNAAQTARLLATIGREAPLPMLSKLFRDRLVELEAHLSQLVGVGLVFERGNRPWRWVVFRHRLLQEAIYNRIPEHTRKALHRKIAKVATTEFQHWLAERPDLFAVHFAAAGSWHEALEAAARAGAQAARDGSHFEACAHYQNALHHLDECSLESEQRSAWELHIRQLMCPSLNASDGWAAETVKHNNTRLALLSNGARSPKSLAESWANFAHACLTHNEPGVEAALASLRMCSPGPARDCVLSVARGNLEFYCGDFAQAKQSLILAKHLLTQEETRRLVLECGQELLVEGPCYLAWIYAIEGNFTLARKEREEAEQFGSQLIVARAFGYLFSTGLGILMSEHHSRESLLSQRTRARELLDIAEQLRHPVFRAVADIALGRLQIAGGDVDDGLATMRRGYDLYKQSGTLLCLAEYAGFVAEALVEEADASEALELLEEVKEHAAHAYCGFYRSEWQRIKARALAAEGQLVEAEALLMSAARSCNLAELAAPDCRGLFLDRIDSALKELYRAKRAL